jgi:hypothetical protein
MIDAGLQLVIVIDDKNVEKLQALSDRPDDVYVVIVGIHSIQ